uniref:Cytomatrix family protein n=1 Tax=Rhizophora mucronata TaxID=61149 RepID=A0A2P2P0Q3_RHIMU
MVAITRYQASSLEVHRSQVYSDREKWNKIFTGLARLLKNQQEQLETLVQERKFLQDRINMQCERWVSDTRLYHDHISRMNEDLIGKEMERLLQASKSDLVAGFKHREASLHKLKLEQTEVELADFREWFHHFSLNLKSGSKDADLKKKEGRRSSLKSSDPKVLEGEVKRLRLEYEKLASEKSTEISALLKEKSFLWHQYNVLECNLTHKLKSKEAEVEMANEKIASVLAHVELLQSSNSEKDEMIGMLKTKIREMEADTNKSKEKIYKLSQQMELLRKFKSDQVTPALNRCNAEDKVSAWAVRSSGRDKHNIAVKKEASSVPVAVPPKDSEKGGRNSKRKAFGVTSIAETPKLFTSAFKVSKLKNSSTPKLFISTPLR